MNEPTVPTKNRYAPRAAPEALVRAKAAHERSQRWYRRWWASMRAALVPKLARIVCPLCGPQRTEVVRVSLPVLVAQRQRACRGCDDPTRPGGIAPACAYLGARRFWFFGWRVFEWCRFCNCILPIKRRVPWARCPAHRWQTPIALHESALLDEDAVRSVNI